MQDQFVPHDESKMLKELGFNEPQLQRGSLFLYQGSYIQGGGIMWQQAEQWLWDKHRIFIQLVEWPNDFGFYFHHDGNVEERRSFNSPIAATKQGVRAAIRHLHLLKKS